MLSPREEIQLAEIERRLIADDPALSARLGSMRRRRQWLRASIHVGAALLTIFVGLFVSITAALAILALTVLIAVMMRSSRS